MKYTLPSKTLVTFALASTCVLAATAPAAAQFGRDPNTLPQRNPVVLPGQPVLVPNPPRPVSQPVNTPAPVYQPAPSNGGGSPAPPNNQTAFNSGFIALTQAPSAFTVAMKNLEFFSGLPNPVAAMRSPRVASGILDLTHTDPPGSLYVNYTKQPAMLVGSNGQQYQTEVVTGVWFTGLVLRAQTPDGKIHQFNATSRFDLNLNTIQMNAALTKPLATQQTFQAALRANPTYSPTIGSNLSPAAIQAVNGAALAARSQVVNEISNGMADAKNYIAAPNIGLVGSFEFTLTNCYCTPDAVKPVQGGPPGRYERDLNAPGSVQGTATLAWVLDGSGVNSADNRSLVIYYRLNDPNLKLLDTLDKGVALTH